MFSTPFHPWTGRKSELAQALTVLTTSATVSWSDLKQAELRVETKLAPTGTRNTSRLFTLPAGVIMMCDQ